MYIYIYIYIRHMESLPLSLSRFTSPGVPESGITREDHRVTSHSHVESGAKRDRANEVGGARAMTSCCGIVCSTMRHIVT